MKHIEQFLSKKNIFPELLKKERCVQIIQEVSGCVVPVSHISFSGKKTFIKTAPAEKIIILFKRKEILEKFKQTPSLSFYTELQ